MAHIVNTAPTVIYAFRRRADGTICFPFASPSIEELLGAAPEQLAQDGALAFSRVHPDDLGRLWAAIAESELQMTVWECEFRITSAAGREFWLETRSVPELEDDGSTLWYGFISDITQRKKAEAAIRESRAKVSFLPPECAQRGFRN